MSSYTSTASSFGEPEGPITVFQFASAAAAARIPEPARDIASGFAEGIDPFKIRVARNSGWRQRASALIQRRFAWRGYASSPLEHDASGRFTLLACVREANVATISATVDSAKGLYVGRLFPDEVQALRDEGRRLCEFTKLAVDESIRSHAVLAAIFHVAYLYVFELHQCTDVLIEVNPRHVRFYQRMLGFRRMTNPRNDPAVNAPAVLMRLELGHSAAEIARLGGRRSAARSEERSLYPEFFAPDEAQRITGRLRDHM